MTTTSPQLHITDRDLELLGAIELHPLTAEQLLRLSNTFRQPFTQLRLLQRRLKRLADSGIIRSWPYSTTTGASPHYFKLNRTGFRLLHGEYEPLPKRRYFEAIAAGHHHHTRCLGDVLVHVLNNIISSGAVLQNFTRENSCRIDADGFILFPDCTFQLSLQSGHKFRYFVELDNGTERIRSAIHTESIERKIRGYDAYQSQFDALDPLRPVVLFITTRSSERTRHILAAARKTMRNPKRTVFLVTDLRTFLSAADPISDVCLTDNRGRQRGLVPAQSKISSPSKSIALAPALC
ncbi:replication-relaxation family protein [Aporhodopirellula aestuarii]|uniref:Replication-relaxation family protein n=1 Tax=Aporhodopirellula aestuarii TaxID=2950107 RepID=A0ABT0UCF0_9BACT|nr:replication-relaxation family protein [Aporhodopirellula aestuarii]MCM2374704.1 replication-relaxation family protein [Aporhodopirellula aestuarii]